MSQKGESHVSTERKDVISVILTPQTYLPWNKEAILVCGKLYGRLADVLANGKPYKIPAPAEKDYLPELQPGEPPLSQNQKDKLFERAYERYYAKVDKLAELKPLIVLHSPCLVWYRIKDHNLAECELPHRLRTE